jgi:hypothetical protein
MIESAKKSPKNQPGVEKKIHILVDGLSKLHDISKIAHVNFSQMQVQKSNCLTIQNVVESSTEHTTLYAKKLLDLTNLVLYRKFWQDSRTNCEEKIRFNFKEVGT